MSVADDIAQAYALDRAGDEHGAIRYYDRAWQAGVPAELRRHFIVGYGSTLRNVGRVDEAVAILATALADDPTYVPFGAFLALALGSNGQPRAALATMLGALLDGNRVGPGYLDGYERALSEYQAELIAAAVSPDVK